MAIDKRYCSSKIILHPKKLSSFLENKIAAPIYVRFKPTNKCNHRCNFCSYNPKTGDLDVRDKMNRIAEIPREKVLETLKDFKDIGVKAITYSGGGEPLIYPHIIEAMKKTLQYGIDLSIITNGQKLNEERAKILSQANWVRISSDASDAKSLSKFRRIPEEWFNELTNNIENFVKIKRKGCELGINYVVHHGNADQVYRSVKHFKNLGVNHVKITPMWNQNFREYHSSINNIVLKQIRGAKEDFSEDGIFTVYDTYVGDYEGASISERKYSRCYIMQIVPVIGADSNVYFCHDKAYASSGILGSIKDKSFKELWFSEEAKKKFETFNPRKECKHHCTGDFKNKLVNGIVSGGKEYKIIRSALGCYGDDVNFI